LELVEPETAGSPESERKWIRSSLHTLSHRLKDAGHGVSAPTVSRLLKKHDYALHVNAKEKDAGSQHPERDRQFEYIEQQKERFLAVGWPVISVDTKKKELIGNFKNPGRSWSRHPIEVNVHDFLTEAEGRGAPYGIYDLARQAGAVYVGTSADTPEFAVRCVAQWWQEHGRAAYPAAPHLLVLADAGGSNGCRPRLWKEQLQSRLSDQLGLTVTVCHYPTGCSKWNPIEHRLFSQISQNWAGQPLRTFDIMLGYMRDTTTSTGLKVSAKLLTGVFAVGKKVTDAVMNTLKIEHHTVCPKWNYTIYPRTEVAGFT
jgi:hypothetical protein